MEIKWHNVISVYVKNVGQLNVLYVKSIKFLNKNSDKRALYLYLIKQPCLSSTIEISIPPEP